MASSRLPGPVRLSAALYRTLLLVYPPSHRRAYGPLMAQAFGDLCGDAHRRRGLPGLILLWPRTLADLIRSAIVEHLSASKELVMAANPTARPLPWREVVLVVVPGTLFAISRVFYPLGVFSLASIVLVAAVAVAVGVGGRKKQLPAWGLLALGMLVCGGLFTIGFLGIYELELRIGINQDARRVLASVLLCAIGIASVAKYARTWSIPSLAWVLLGLTVFCGFMPSGYYLATLPAREDAWTVLVTGILPSMTLTGFLLLPVALGLHLARRHGPLATLFVVGAHSVWFGDSDNISGWLLRDMAFYPLYAVLLPLLFVGVAPLLFLRARSWRGQVIGLLGPITAVLVARDVVPLLARGPDVHPLRVWGGDTLLSIMVLLTFALTLVVYRDQQADDAPRAAPIAAESDHPAYAG